MTRTAAPTSARSPLWAFTVDVMIMAASDATAAANIPIRGEVLATKKCEGRPVGALVGDLLGGDRA